MSISIWMNTRRVWLAAGVLSTAAMVAVSSANALAAQPPGGAAGESCPDGHAMGGMGHDAKMGAGPSMMPGLMPFAGRGMERMAKHLDLNAQQKEQIQKIQTTARANMEQLREEGRSLHEQGAQLWSAAKLDEGAIEQWRQKLSAHHDKMSQQMSRVMLDIAKVLTPEQRTKAVAYMKTRAERHHMRQGMQGHSH